MNFSEGIKNTDNYYVVISQKTFSDIPYSVYSIYELKVKESAEYSGVIVRNQRIYSNSNDAFTPSLIITEDSARRLQLSTSHNLRSKL